MNSEVDICYLMMLMISVGLLGVDSWGGFWGVRGGERRQHGRGFWGGLQGRCGGGPAADVAVIGSTIPRLPVIGEAAAKAKENRCRFRPKIFFISVALPKM